MTINLLYFGTLKDLTGTDRDTITLPEPATVADLLNLLRGHSSHPPAVWSSLAVAVNREYATLTTPLHHSDEVALLPPVSGGGKKPCA